MAGPVKTYAPSGAWSPLGFCLALLGGALAITPFAWLEATLPQASFPQGEITGLTLFVVLALALVPVSRLAARLGAVRNVTVARVLGVLLALWALHVAWTTWACEVSARAEGPRFTPGQLLLLPGRTLEVAWRAHARGFGDVRRGDALRLSIWAVEALGLVAVGALAPTAALARPYCETCGTWCAKEVLGRLPAGGSSAVAIAGLEARDWTRLLALPANPSTTAELRLELDACPRCGDANAFSLLYVTIATGTALRWIDRAVLTPEEAGDLREALHAALTEHAKRPRAPGMGPAPPAPAPLDPERRARLALAGRSIRDRLASARRAREEAVGELVAHEDGLVHGPTRAEAILGGLRALALSPLVFLGAIAALSFVDALVGGKYLGSLNGRAALSLLGSGAVGTFILSLVLKVPPRRLSSVRVRVFERGSLEPYLLGLLVLTEGCCVLFLVLA